MGNDQQPRRTGTVYGNAKLGAGPVVAFEVAPDEEVGIIETRPDDPADPDALYRELRTLLARGRRWINGTPQIESWELDNLSRLLRPARQPAGERDGK